MSNISRQTRTSNIISIIAVFLALTIVSLVFTSAAFSFSAQCNRQNKFALAIHGGAVWGAVTHINKENFVRDQLRAGRKRLAAGHKAVNVVASVVAAMENSGLFNAGKGSVANRSGEIEMDASIMEGRHLRAGSVASVRKLKNPILAAKLVMDNTPHVMMVGPSADKYLAEIGAQQVEQNYFLYSGRDFSDITFPSNFAPAKVNPAIHPSISKLAGIWAGVLGGKLNHVLIVNSVDAHGGDVVVALGSNESLGLVSPITFNARAKFLNQYLIVETNRFRISYREAGNRGIEARLTVKNGGRVSGVLKKRPELLKRSGTVGAVALDRCGILAAGTSTGGFGSKQPGRVGDTPIIGAGTYADNRGAAVSATGHGEYFIRHAVAHEISARIRHGGQSLIQASYQVIFKELKPVGGEGGVIAVNKRGEIVMLFNTDGMVRGSTTDQISPQVATYPNN